LLSQRAPSPRALKEQVIRGFSRFFTQATHRNNATSSNSHIVIGGQFFISQPPHDKSSRRGDKFVPNQIAPLNLGWFVSGPLSYLILFYFSFFIVLISFYFILGLFFFLSIFYYYLIFIFILFSSFLFYFK